MSPEGNDMASKRERARQYYEQCQEAYDEFLTIPHAKSILNVNGRDIDMPSSFYDAYNVPAELLRSVTRPDATSDGDRTGFEYKLLEMMHDKAPFDFDTLKKKDGLKDKRKQKIYKVYFEIYYKQSKSSEPLFKQQVTIGGITYRWCSRKVFNQQIRSLESQIDVGQGLYKQRCSERFSLHRDDTINHYNLRPLVTTVKAYNEIEATNIASQRFDNYITSINVLQVRGKQSVTWFSSKPKTKHKTTVVSIGVFLVKTESKPIDILIENSRKVLPTESLTITDQPARMTQLNILTKAFNDNSPAAVRLSSVTRELAQAIDTDNPNLRQLSYWRCLEIVTAKSGDETRKEADVVKIFQNYYPKIKHWHQMGDIIKNTRNSYVHRGVSETGEELSEYHLNWSQQYAEVAFGIAYYLYKHKAIWKTFDDIDIFFDAYTKTDHELSLTNKFLRTRTGSRHKSSKPQR